MGTLQAKGACSFSREHRLLRRSEFTACYNTGQRYFSKHFVLFVLSGTTGLPWRLGLAVTRKSGNAVWRNRIKRLIREFFRLHQDLLAAAPNAIDIVVVPKRTLNPRQLTLDRLTSEFLPLVRAWQQKSINTQ